MDDREAESPTHPRSRGARGSEGSASLRELAPTVGVLAAILAGLLLAGMLGFVLIGNEGAEEAFYRSFGAFTALQLFAEPPTSQERALTAVLRLTGLLFYLVVLLSAVRKLGPQAVQRWWDDRSRREREKRMELKDHYIVCGYGNVGRAVVTALLQSGQKVVVIDRNQENVDDALRGGDPEQILGFKGEASEKEILRRAGVERAKGVLACVKTDAENIYILLTAQQENDGIRLATRVSDADNMKRFRELTQDGKLGSSPFHAVSPYESAGTELADSVTRELPATEP